LETGADRERGAFGLAAEAAEAAWHIGLKSDAGLFPIVAHVDTGFNLFADHMRGCDFDLAGELGGIDCLTGFLADQQIGEGAGARQAADMADQDAVAAHQHGRFPVSLNGQASCGKPSRTRKCTGLTV
jgi:hypothetical protein